MRLQRYKKPKTNRVNPNRVPGHLQYVRGFACVVDDCQQRAEAHHIKVGLPSDETHGTGMKGHDKWTVPLCRFHHAEIHNGHKKFVNKYRLDLLAAAERLWQGSPHRRKHEEKIARS